MCGGSYFPRVGIVELFFSYEIDSCEIQAGIVLEGHQLNFTQGKQREEEQE